MSVIMKTPTGQIKLYCKGAVSTFILYILTTGIVIWYIHVYLNIFVTITFCSHWYIYWNRTLLSTRDWAIISYTKMLHWNIWKSLQRTVRIHVHALRVQRKCFSLETFVLFNTGLRTLCISMAEISQEEYDRWSDIYYRASTSLENRDEKVDEAAELIEKVSFISL